MPIGCRCVTCAESFASSSSQTGSRWNTNPIGATRIAAPFPSDPPGKTARMISLVSLPAQFRQRAAVCRVRSIARAGNSFRISAIADPDRYNPFRVDIPRRRSSSAYHPCRTIRRQEEMRSVWMRRQNRDKSCRQADPQMAPPARRQPLGQGCSQEIDLAEMARDWSSPDDNLHNRPAGRQCSAFFSRRKRLETQQQSRSPPAAFAG